jgi:hypothetical protein
MCGEWTIWKFPLEIADEQFIKMPSGAKILCCQMQDEIPCLWAIVDPTTTAAEQRIIRIIPTGGPVDVFAGQQTLRYIGTVQERVFVWHVFEKAC